MNMYENTQNYNHTDSCNTYTDSRSGLVFLNTSPHDLNLIKKSAVFPNRNSANSGKYVLNPDYCENLDAASFCVVKRSCYVLSVNKIRESKLNNNLDIEDFDKDISDRDREADIIVISEKCARLLRSKVEEYHWGIPVYSKVSVLNNLRWTADPNKNCWNWMTTQIFLDRFYVPADMVYLPDKKETERHKKETERRVSKVVGACNLKKVFPVLPRAACMYALCHGWPISRLGANLVGLCLYREACQNYNWEQYEQFKDLLKEYYKVHGRPCYDHYSEDCLNFFPGQCAPMNCF